MCDAIAIVIGSGIGCMTAVGLLAGAAGKKVLVGQHRHRSRGARRAQRGRLTPTAVALLIDQVLKP